jgi:hypothetical protein
MTLKHPNGIDDLCICHEHRPVCDCRAPSAPPAPGADLTDEQVRFLRFLNASDYIETWKKHFRGATVQATTSKGRKAALSLADIDEMISLGYMQAGWGASYCLTEKGKAFK